MTELNKVAEVAVIYRPLRNPSAAPKVTSSRDSYHLFLEHWSEDTIYLFESFKVLLINRAQRVIGIFTASTGGVNGTVVDPRLIFSVAIKALASSIILAHNHPSGNLKPSSADLKLTEKLTQAGKFLEIPVLDHLIISEEGYYSFADEGML